MRSVPLIIFGAGKVGRALVQQLLEATEYHAQRSGLAFPVVAWCDHDGAVMADKGIASDVLQRLLVAKADGAFFADTEFGSLQSDPRAIVDVAGTHGCMVVDVTASEATLPALELALCRGYRVATANKVPLAGPQVVFDQLTRGDRLGYESTVGSAVPVIASAQRLVRAADQIDTVLGALSGTLGFLCTGLQAGQSFSVLVAEAMLRGYTEPDPRIDLGGMDVARKALILARTLGWKLELDDVQVDGLLPAEYADVPLTECLARLPELDADFAAQMAAATAQDQALRYLAELKGEHITVGLHSVPADSALGQLKGNDNLVAFHTRYYPDTPLVLQGRGAGVAAAAAGVHADILALAGW